MKGFIVFAKLPIILLPFCVILIASSIRCGAQDDSKTPTTEQVLTGKVKKVIDGDSLIVLDSEAKEHEIQLEGIDAPEAKQDYGKEASKELEKLVAGKDVNIKWKSKDNFGRILGKVHVGEDYINLEMLKVGAAWHFKRYNKEEDLAKAEEKAKEDRLGLWKGTSPEAPWDFRRKNRTKE
jgi:micrococcal nuclease